MIKYYALSNQCDAQVIRFDSVKGQTKKANTNNKCAIKYPI